MSDYHILEVGTNGEMANVVFHIPVPEETSFSGVSLSTALKDQLEAALESGATITSSYPNITPLELSQLQWGTIREASLSIRFNVNWTKAQKRNHIDDMYSHIVTTTQNNLRATLDFWGYSRDVP